MNRIHLLILLLLAVVAVPFAAADTIQLTNSTYGTIGTVTLTQQAGGVLVTLNHASGFSFKTSGGDILFNTSASLTSGSISGFTVDGMTPGFTFMTGQTRASSLFAYDLANLAGGNMPHNYQSANTISFFISGVTVSQLEQGNPSWGVHFCVGGDTTHRCGEVTGFATGKLTVVPEPGTLSLLGTGLVGIAGVMRRRFFA